MGLFSPPPSSLLSRRPAPTPTPTPLTYHNIHIAQSHEISMSSSIIADASPRPTQPNPHSSAAAHFSLSPPAGKKSFAVGVGGKAGRETLRRRFNLNCKLRENLFTPFIPPSPPPLLCLPLANSHKRHDFFFLWPDFARGVRLLLLHLQHLHPPSPLRRRRRRLLLLLLLLWPPDLPRRRPPRQPVAGQGQGGRRQRLPPQLLPVGGLPAVPAEPVVLPPPQPVQVRAEPNLDCEFVVCVFPAKALLLIKCNLVNVVVFL